MTECRYCHALEVADNQCGECMVVQVIPKAEGRWLI